MAKHCQMGEHGVRRSLNSLVKNGLLTNEPRTGQTTIYRVATPYSSVTGKSDTTDESVSTPLTDQTGDPLQISQTKVLPEGTPNKGEGSLAKKRLSKEEAREYFEQIGASVKEAEKFFSNYQSLGWKKRGQPIYDWKALADLWMQRAADFESTTKYNNGEAGSLDNIPLLK